MVGCGAGRANVFTMTHVRGNATMGNLWRVTCGNREQICDMRHMCCVARHMWPTPPTTRHDTCNT
eukprot:10574173-Prorocentrum_lima.AAC.1